MPGTNTLTLAYYGNPQITAVKSFIVQAPGLPSVTKETSFDDVVTCPVRVVDEELVQAEVPEQEIGPHFRWKYCETFYDRIYEL